MNPDWLAPGPLQELIERDVEKHGSITALAGFVGMYERQVRRVLVQKYVTEDFADRYCIATGRHLSDVYPELYPDDNREVFPHTCPVCSHDRMTVVGEGRYRLMLECQVCGGKTQILSPSDPCREQLRRSRPDNRRHDLDARIGEIIERYEAGATYAELSRELVCSPGTLTRLFERHGYQPRPKGGTTEGIRRGHERWRRQNTLRVRAMRWRIARLAESGLKTREIRKIVGYSPQGVRNLRRAHALEPFEQRVCIDPECERYDAFYPVPPADVCELDPTLALCPSCGGVGEPGALWEAAS